MLGAVIPNPDDSLIASLSRSAVDIVSSVVHPRQHVALLDFPRHYNVGDSAIWLGEMRCLAACGVRPPDIRYTCDISTFDETTLRRAIGKDGIILFHGGGNFGDLWNRHELFRETVIAAFPSNPIVVLPQTVHFRDKQALHRAASVLNRHENLTILARDQSSLGQLQISFNATARLCPDLAFCLAPLPRSIIADQDIVYLARTDQESNSANSSTTSYATAGCDWSDCESAWQWKIGNATARWEADHPRVARMLHSVAAGVLRANWNRMAGERLLSGCRLLARGRVVVTDRLHAHILTLLMGIPHVVLDNNYGKIRRFHDTWTAPSVLTRFAFAPDEAFETAGAMLVDCI